MNLKPIRKKGDPTDITLLLIMLFFLAVSFVVVIFVNTKIQDVITETPLNDTSTSSSIVSAFENVNTYTVQRGFVLFFSLLVIAILASSFLIRVHPIFIFIYIFTLAFAIFIAVFLANTYEAVATNAAFASLTSSTTMITWIMQHIIEIMVAVGALSMIIIFGKVIGGGGGATYQSDIT